MSALACVTLYLLKLIKLRIYFYSMLTVIINNIKLRKCLVGLAESPFIIKIIIKILKNALILIIISKISNTKYIIK